LFYFRNYGAYEDENPYSAYQNNHAKNNMNSGPNKFKNTE